MPEPAAIAKTPLGSRYPLAIALAACLCGIVLDRFTSCTAELWWIVALCAWLLWLVTMVRRANRWPIFLLLVAAATTSACWHSARWNRFDPAELSRFAAAERAPVCLRVTACRSPRRMAAPSFSPLRAMPTGERSQLDVRVDAIRDCTDWRPASGRATLLVDGHLLSVQAGDQLQVFGKLSLTTPAMNPGEFDFAVHARRDRRLCLLETGYPDAVEHIAQRSSWQPAATIDRLRHYGNDRLWSELSHEQSGLAAAIMLGAREQLGRERNEAFFQTGTVHLMAISGLHVGLLALGLGLLLRVLMVPERRALVLVAVACTVYVLVTDARPPAVRALIIVLVLCFGRALGRQTNSWNTLALAGIVVLAFNPTEVFRTGTQLSFLAVAVLIWAGTALLRHRERSPLERLIAESRPVWQKLAKWSASWFGRAVLMTTAIWLVALPLVMARFHLVPTVGLFLGPLLAIPVAIALASGFLLLAVGWLWSPLAASLAWVCDSMLASVQWAVGRSHDTPISHAWVAGPDDWWLLGFYATLAALLMLGRRRPRPSWCVAIVAVWIAVGFAAALPSARPRRQLACTFISVGHGSCVLVELADGRNLLYDAGRLGAPESGARSIASYLWHRGITRLDAVIVSHADVDHYNALPELLERFDVGVAYVSPVMFEDESASVKLLQSALAKSDVPIREVWLGDRLATDAETRITVMHPPRDGTLGSDNANSIVLLIEYAGRRILLPGDLEDLGMADLLAEPPIDCDVVLTPHHGSTRSNPPGFTAWCQPEWAIVSGGINHDVESVIAAYRAAGCRVLHSGRAGTVRCVLSADGVTVNTCHPSDDVR